MKIANLILTLTLLFICSIKGQTIRNFGDLEIHTNGKIGFYSSLENDGIFNNTSGLAGFYGIDRNFISGSISPFFYDVEINNDQGIVLQVPMAVRNNTNFIFGDFITYKKFDASYLELFSTSFYNGESNFSKINGLLSISNVQNFLFPIGDETYLRPLAIDTGGISATFKGAYFFENGTITYSNSIEDTAELRAINDQEYWTLEGDTSTIVTLGWNERSILRAITNDLDHITVVGFDSELLKWTNLGATDRTGNIEDGFISSSKFVPNRYSAITLGILQTKAPVLHKGYHYIVTPNGDGINDFLYIPELEDYESNRLLIFARNGLKVFEQDNYFNQFDGKTGVSIPTISRDTGLPEGVYFYLVTAGEDNLPIQGFLYLDR
ncbi:gliding motility-associated C-terminal domain-containing protein [Zobellia sp.]|nr:gliding motility-associated C-terminal domain-containing protein [Zobellia sp.]